MAYRHPKTWSRQDWFVNNATLDMMWRGCWHVTVACDTCDFRRPVDLKKLIDRHGPGFGLWNKQPACAREGCGGALTFFGKPAEGGADGMPLIGVEVS